MNKYKVGECGLKEETVNMFARTSNGVIGKIKNANADNLLLGPEILVEDALMCIDRDSIIDIQERFSELLKVGDIVSGVLNHEVVVQVDEETITVYRYNLKDNKYSRDSMYKCIYEMSLHKPFLENAL